MTKIVSWDKPSLKAFKREYEKAVRRGWKTFTFHGNEYVVGYAKYLIEYLEGVLK